MDHFTSTFAVNQLFYPFLLAISLVLTLISIVLVSNSPKSSGRVSLRSKNPLHKPVIEPNYFAHREDINVLIEGIRIACNISDQPAMKRFGSRLHRIPFPGCRDLPFDSDEYWECSIRQVSAVRFYFHSILESNGFDSFGFFFQTVHIHNLPSDRHSENGTKL